MANVDKIIKACRDYLLKARTVPIVLLVLAVVNFTTLALNADRLFGEELGITWLFVVLDVAAALFLIREVYLNAFARPGRLRIHLNNLPAEDRTRLVEEFAVAIPSHGRYFLSEFMLFFPFESGIIRYSMIDEVSVYTNSIGISGGGRLFFLKTEKSEDPDELAQKIIDRIPEKPDSEDIENIEDIENELPEIPTEEISGDDE